MHGLILKRQLRHSAGKREYGMEKRVERDSQTARRRLRARDREINVNSRATTKALN